MGYYTDYGEMRLSPDRPDYDKQTGRFLKGHVPFNKGKTWDEIKMPKRSRKRIAKGWKNLELHRPTKRPDNAGRCRKPVIGLDDDGTFHYFSYMGEAAEYVNGRRENIRRCCQSNLVHHKNKKTGAVNTDHKYNGVRFYFEIDTTWISKIKQN